MGAFSDRRAIALAKLPGQIRDAMRDFQRLTGITAVTTLGSASAGELPPWPPGARCSPSVRGNRIHTCPLGLRCAGVPIAIDDRLIGLAKVVCDAKIPEKRFRSLVNLLEALIAQPCQALHVLLLQEEIHTLYVSMNRLRRARWAAWGDVNAPAARPAPEGGHQAGSLGAQALIGQVLEYLDQHSAEPDLTLSQVARAVGRNEKYLAHLFVEQVGERMRAYITRVRVRRSCELLLQTEMTIQRIAHDSGFTDAAQFRQAFRRIIGVTASEYRQIFAAGA